jgi:hypothetical protein
MSTISRLAAITDQAGFERLATAVLREAEPRYASLLHPGVNVNGKTVKAPVDGIGFIAGANPPHMIAAHHTTCRRDDLRKKWLHVSGAGEARKRGRPATPPGDFVKTVEIVHAERMANPTLRATLILTTNQEPPEELVREAHALGRAEGIEIDIWSVSRLAHFLDNSGSGQWLRRQHLGIGQERLSHELLGRISQNSLHISVPAKDQKAWISTQLDTDIADAMRSQDTVFVLAESGMGKSVACYKQLSHHIAQGGFGLVLSHTVVSSSLTIDQAIEATLCQLSPALTTGVGSDALALCSPERPLLLVVEDINKSGQATALAEKLASWSTLGTETSGDQSSNSFNSKRRWRLICPIWPQIVASLSDTSRKGIEHVAVFGGPLTIQEGGKSVLLRAGLKGASLSVLEAENISQALGNDPLLIALHEPEDVPRPEHVIEGFIGSSVTRMAIHRGDYTASDYRATLRSLAQNMLDQRDLGPSWETLLMWFAGAKDSTAMLRHLVHHGEIVHLSGTPTSQTLNFRHDRVRDALLTNAAAARMRNGNLTDDLLSEPYFAEILGSAVLKDGIPLAIIDRIQGRNPLALFHSLRLFKKPAREIEYAILRAIELWLKDDETHKPRNNYLRWEALAALSLTESSHVVRLVRQFNDHIWTAWEALLRNGEFLGALNLCLAIEPGSGAPWRDSQMQHAKTHFSSRFGTEINRLLRREDVDTNVRVGALRVAGYLGDHSLAESIEASWGRDPEKIDHLAEYMWAAARCCEDDPIRYLKPLCDAWAALPGETADNKPSDRDNFAAHHLKWAFRDNIPVSAIAYFIERAKDELLCWPITYMLNGLDHPDAVEFVVEEVAKKTRAVEGTDRFSPFAVSATDEWVRQDEYGRPMSPESRNRLFALCQDPANDKHLREQAFRYWATAKTATDLDVLRSVDPSVPFADSVLRQRLERGDGSAVPALLETLERKPKHRRYWWQFVRPVWCTELLTALEAELGLRSSSAERKWNATYATDDAIYKLIMELPKGQAEFLLVEHWDHLRFQRDFVQAALYVGTPPLLSAVEEVIGCCPNPHAMFNHIDMHYGIRTKGRSGITSRQQLESLGRYVQYLDEHAIYTFWELCNQNGWFDLRRELFDPHVDRKYHMVGLDDPNRIWTMLDEMIATNRGHWLEHMVEDVLKVGISNERLFFVIQAWLSDRGTVAALELAARAVIQVGTRNDLQLLKLDAEPRAIVADLLVDTTFALKRKRLN